MLKLYIQTLVLVGLVISTASAHASRTDVIRLPNGDEVTGEIKSLNFGVLNYGTDSMGTVSIEWEDIVLIQSGSSLQVELTNGKRYFGSLKRSGADYYVGLLRLARSVGLLRRLWRVERECQSAPRPDQTPGGRSGRCRPRVSACPEETG
jgi:hypothetical protein